MINWFDMPAEGLSNGGLFEVKELEVTENGTYETKGEMYNKVTVNVEGGGGSSDFSTAEVTVVNTNEGTARTMNGANAVDDGEDTGSVGSMAMPINTTKTFLAILYKGVAWISKGDATIVSVSGDAEKLGSAMVMVTGDCTITIS